jgi:hypothetical protein
MTTTAIGLALASITTGATRTINVLDGIISSYLLALPLIIAAFATVRSASHRSGATPIMVIAGLLRDALAAAFGLWLWATSPRFGKNPECNNQVNFVFFGARLRATSPAARAIGLLFWATICLFVLIDVISHHKTVYFAIRSLFSREEATTLRLPLRTVPFSSFSRWKYSTEAYLCLGCNFLGLFEYTILRWTVSSSVAGVLRPMTQFHGTYSIIPADLVQRIVPQVIRTLSLSLALLSWAFIMIMTELELSIVSKTTSVDNTFGFGQVFAIRWPKR